MKIHERNQNHFPCSDVVQQQFTTAEEINEQRKKHEEKKQVKDKRTDMEGLTSVSRDSVGKNTSWFKVPKFTPEQWSFRNGGNKKHGHLNVSL